MSHRTRIGAWSVCLALASASVPAEPWLAPGDESLRHDVQLLADAGVLKGPVTAWPLSWPEIMRDLDALPAAAADGPLADIIYRVQSRARIAARSGLGAPDAHLSLAEKPDALRGFQDDPRGKAEAGAGIGWLGEHLALQVNVAAVSDDRDDQRVRADGTYFAANAGNVVLTAGWVDRWWGPGWDGSLILSNNARPVPSIALDRKTADPFESRLLSWIGPWRATLFMGELEGDSSGVSHTRLVGARVTARPRPWLEIALTRTAQWCGAGRPCGWRTLRDLALGRDNRSAALPEEREPGNQLAGYEVRARSPWPRIPLALYGQYIGEDEAGGLPSKFLGLFGAEGWTAGAWGSLRLRVEYADTACSFSRATPEFNCAYRNGLYPQGYTFRERPLGHSLDNDGRQLSLGATFVDPRGTAISARVRRAELNRDGLGQHAISGAALTLNDVELRYSRSFGFGRVSAGIGHSDPGDGAYEDRGARGFLDWHKGF